MILTKIEEIVKQSNIICLFFTTCFFGAKITFLNQRIFLKLTNILMPICTFLLTVLLLLRWKTSGHFPLSNLYESCLFFSWVLTIIHVFLESRMNNNWIGIITAPSALLIQVFSTEGLSEKMQERSLLVPALQSNWLMMHVSMMILSYGILFVGSLLAITLLTINYKIQKNENLLESTLRYQDNMSFLVNDISFSSQFFSLDSIFLNVRAINLIKQLDYWSYRAINVGFLFLTIGILSGAVWANEAWGSFWSWDPKETWALITWLTFATYLHTRMINNWNEPKRALVALLGFFIVWICYLGVNLLGKGLHSYGWLK